MITHLERALIRVDGADAKSFLQGLLTQNLDRLAHKPCVYAALLSPQGKIVVDMIVWADGEAFILDVDPTRGAELMKRLSMYKLRAQVTLDELSASHAVLVSEQAFDGAHPDPRLAALGWRSVVRAPTDARDDPTTYETRRVALGVPDLARDAEPEEVFALEGLLEELNGVDFQKGCFVGQENVSRMKRRATTRKKFCPIVFDGDPPAYGAPVSAVAADLGSVRSGAVGRAIALLRLDRALAAEDTLMADGKPVRLDPPPWLILPEAQA